MPKQTPYIQRRGHALEFRLAVPQDLRTTIGCRELVRSLRTGDREIAVPIALRFAAIAKALFIDLRRYMTDTDKSKLEEQVRAAKHKLQLDVERDQHSDELIDQKQQHLRDLKTARLEERSALLDSLISAGISTTTTPTEFIKGPVVDCPTFGRVINDFLETYAAVKHAEMFKKHSVVLPMLRDLIGAEKPVTQLRQADLINFFAVVQRLPPRWKSEARKRRLAVRELAAIEHPEGMAPKSFDDTYKASVRAFLVVAKSRWQDQGFPTTLTTDGISYSGRRNEGERTQRAFRHDELKRLFEGPEMQAYAADTMRAHFYWLPHVGFYTGARVNEICQINPQTDVREEEGVWFFDITGDSAGDERVTKRTKTVDSNRKVPVHSKLLELGFLDYVKRVKATGAKLLFPLWEPERGKASPKAEEWFIQLLRDMGLRDETPNACLIGMHAFRHTLMNRALNSSVDAKAITGHASDKSKVQRGYEGKLTLVNLRNVLESIEFDELNFVPNTH